MPKTADDKFLCDEGQPHPATFMLGEDSDYVEDGVNVYACVEHLGVVAKEYIKFHDPCGIKSIAAE